MWLVAIRSGLRCLVFSLLILGRPADAARCDSDATPIAPKTEPGNAVEVNGDDPNLCTSAEVQRELSTACHTALQGVRKACDDACKTFKKLDKDENLTETMCSRDKDKSTTSSTPACTLVRGGKPVKSTASPKCTASISCQCDP